MNAPARITDPTLPRPSWQRSYADQAGYEALVIPNDLPAFTREYLEQLDGQIAGHALLRLGEITDASRLNEAGWQHNHTKDGTAKLMLHTYVTLLTEQAETRQEKVSK